VREFLVFGNENEAKDYYAEEGQTGLLARMHSIPWLAETMADDVFNAKSRNEEAIVLKFSPVDPLYHVAHGPGDLKPRLLTETELALFNEWFEAKKKFLELKEKYGFQ